ncbi:MAG: flagellar hook-basal body complex protein, partial [Lachnospira sp.]|nr:flagellar hook-basal body complex protein [Lachnospira sp.]
MMRSLFSAVSGLKAHQTKMDVIGNNIANVNTVAYKSQSVTFNDVYYQTTQTASGPNSESGKGGTNAKQIGLGSSVASISTAVSSQGATERTDNAWDLCIAGDCFFVVSNAGETYFTRAGDFKVDVDGALVTSGGAAVMGWVTDPDTNEIIRDKVQPIYVQSPEYTYTAPAATTGVTIKGNINASSTGSSAFTYNFFDSLGNEYQATMKAYDRLYKGVDLEVKFASEIAQYGNVYAWLQARKNAGNYDGIHIGDYFHTSLKAGTIAGYSIPAQNFKCRIIGLNTYKSCADAAVGNMIYVSTDEVIDTPIKWNPTDNNNGTANQTHPWLASAMYAILNGVNNYDATSGYNKAAHGANGGAGIISL